MEQILVLFRSLSGEHKSVWLQYASSHPANQRKGVDEEAWLKMLASQTRNIVKSSTKTGLHFVAELTVHGKYILITSIRGPVELEELEFSLLRSECEALFKQ